MQYLLMCCFDENLWARIPDSQRDEIMRDTASFTKVLSTAVITLAAPSLARAQPQRLSARRTANRSSPMVRSPRPRSSLAAITSSSAGISTRRSRSRCAFLRSARAAR